MSDSVRPHRRQPIRLPRPWDSPGKNTRVGCLFLLLNSLYDLLLSGSHPTVNTHPGLPRKAPWTFCAETEFWGKPNGWSHSSSFISSLICHSPLQLQRISVSSLCCLGFTPYLQQCYPLVRNTSLYLLFFLSYFLLFLQDYVLKYKYKFQN